MKNILKIVFLIIGTLIGAGFASGREIYIFFTKFGIYGIFGIIISGILTGIIINKVMKITKNTEIKNYNNLLNITNKKYPRINKIINLIVNAFLLISFFIMIAGFCAYMKQTYEISTYLSSIIFTIICGIIFLRNIEGIIKANEILVPILILLISYLGIKNIPYLTNINIQELIQVNSKGWFINSILYASYNSIILIPVLSSLKIKNIENKQINLISIITSLIIIILSFFIYGLLLRGNYYIQQLELPLIEISLEFGKIFKYIYGIVIIISIFTSAISTGYSFLKNVSKNRKQYICMLIMISIIGILVSNIGFSKLVEILYPTFGILGIIQIVLIMK